MILHTVDKKIPFVHFVFELSMLSYVLINAIHTCAAAREFGLHVDLRITSAHKATEETLRIMQEYEDTHGALVFIAVAGRSNGLGPVLSGNTSYPVINCPPPSDKLVQVNKPNPALRTKKSTSTFSKIVSILT